MVVKNDDLFAKTVCYLNQNLQIYGTPSLLVLHLIMEIKSCIGRRSRFRKDKKQEYCADLLSQFSNPLFVIIVVVQNFLCLLTLVDAKNHCSNMAHV